MGLSKGSLKASITFKVFSELAIIFDKSLGMGFDAIWISPVVECIGGAYHGYAALNIYNINPKFGTEQDLHDLVEECHKRDIWVMLDVVANHVAYIDE